MNIIITIQAFVRRTVSANNTESEAQNIAEMTIIDAKKTLKSFV